MNGLRIISLLVRFAVLLVSKYRRATVYKLPSMENRGQADRVTTPAHAELRHARLTTVAMETYYYGHQSLLKTPQWIVTSKLLH